MLKYIREYASTRATSLTPYPFLFQKEELAPRKSETSACGRGWIKHAAHALPSFKKRRVDRFIGRGGSKTSSLQTSFKKFAEYQTFSRKSNTPLTYCPPSKKGGSTDSSVGVDQNELTSNFLYVHPSKFRSSIYYCLLYTSPSPRDRG